MSDFEEHDDEGWAESPDDEDWDKTSNEDTQIRQTEVVDHSAVKIYEINEVESKQIPKRIQEIKEMLGLTNNDTVLSILRHFNYNNENVQNYMFADDKEKEKLDIKIGLKYNLELNTKYPEITERLREM